MPIGTRVTPKQDHHYGDFTIGLDDYGSVVNNDGSFVIVKWDKDVPLGSLWQGTFHPLTAMSACDLDVLS